MALNPEYLKVGQDIIKAAYNVRNEAGKNFRESFYKAALAWELRQLGHEVETEISVPVIYKGVLIDDAYKADLVVDGKVIIELKALRKIGESEVRQLFSYMKLSSIRLGYLINFGAEEFVFGRVTDRIPYEKGLYRIVHNL